MPADRNADESATELYRRYRPRTLGELVGQPQVVSMVQSWIDKDRIPHVLLLEGPSGTGKTTVGRILREHLGCFETDFFELNAAGNVRGIDEIRRIQQEMYLSVRGRSRIYLVDECHQLTGDAQEALLKTLEDTPKHVWFMLATTNPGKLRKTIRTRATTVSFKPLGQPDLMTVLRRAAKGEKKKVADEVLEKIAEAAEGSPRLALVELGRVIDLPEKEALEALRAGFKQGVAFDLVKLLLPWDGTRAGWKQVAAVLEAIKEEEPEQVRQLILANARTMLVRNTGPKADKAFRVIDVLRQPFFDRNSGHALLAAACYEIVTDDGK